MKILLVAMDLFGPPGGIARHCRLALKALTGDKRVSAVDVVSLLDNPHSKPDPDYFGAAGRSYLACGADRRLLVRRVLDALRRERYDLVLAGHVNLAPLLLTSAVRRGGPKRLTMIYGVDAWIRLPLLRRLALQRSHRVLAISGYTARETARRNQLDGARVDVTYGCLDPSLQRTPAAAIATNGTSAPPTGERHALLTVSRLWRSESSKGQHAVLRALPRVLESVPSATYWIVGEGDLQPDLQQMSADLGVAGHVRFFGSVPDATLRRCYENCAVYVMPSKWEGFGLAFLEAMAYARPIIGGARDAAPEILGNAAFLVDPENVDQLGEAMIRVLSEPELQTRLGVAGQQRLTNYFTFDHFRSRLWSSLERSLQC